MAAIACGARGVGGGPLFTPAAPLALNSCNIIATSGRSCPLLHTLQSFTGERVKHLWHFRRMRLTPVLFIRTIKQPQGMDSLTFLSCIYLIPVLIPLHTLSNASPCLLDAPLNFFLHCYIFPMALMSFHFIFPHLPQRS